MSNANQVMEAFFTRQRANEGIDLPLSLPNGEPTSHSIKIRGVDSDAFKAAEADQRRRVYEAAAEEDPKKLSAMLADIVLDNTVALVMSWTFENECTPENVKKFLREAPQIADQIDRLASKRSIFFAKSSADSSPSPAQSSS